MIVDSGSARRHSVDLGALLEATSTTTSSSDDVVDLAAQRATRSTLRTRNQQTGRRLPSPTGVPPSMQGYPRRRPRVDNPDLGRLPAARSGGRAPRARSPDLVSNHGEFGVEHRRGPITV